MAYVRGNNIQDGSLSPAAFALPNAAAGATHSAVLDLGAEAFKQPDREFNLVVPALAVGLIPDTKTVTYTIETSTTANFAAISQTLLYVQLTGAGGVGVAAVDQRIRIPSNCAQYLRATVTLGAATNDSSAVSATLTQLF